MGTADPNAFNTTPDTRRYRRDGRSLAPYRKPRVHVAGRIAECLAREAMANMDFNTCGSLYRRRFGQRAAVEPGILQCGQPRGRGVFDRARDFDRLYGIGECLELC